MKDETKMKIRKAAKIGGLIAGFLATFILGMGFGSCSEKKVQDQSSQKQSQAKAVLNGLSMAQPHRVAPPLSPSVFTTLDPSEDNLLLGAYGGHCIYSFLEGPLFKIEQQSNFDCFLLRDLPKGLYRLTASNLTSWVGDYGFVADGVCNSIISVLNGVAGSFVTDLDNRFGSFDVFSPNTYFSIDSSLDNLLLRCNAGSSVKLTLIDAKDIPAAAGYDFPTEFFPYGLSGNRKSEYFCGGPSVPSGTLANSYTVTLNGLYFESNGVFYNAIMFIYSYRANMPVLYYSDTGSLLVRTTAGQNSSDPNYFPQSMLYLNTIDSSVKPVEVWQANFASIDSLDFNYGLLAGGLWLKTEYRHINVVAFYNPSVDGLPSTAIGQYSVAGWLDWLSVDRVVYDPTNAQGNPFTLLSQGFSAVGGILQIQILPMITLGTLIFVPLIVLVIMAILKVLNK